MKKLYLCFITLLLVFAVNSFASVQRIFQDVKLPSQEVLEHQTFTNIQAAGTTGIISANAGPTSADEIVITTGITNPDQPRNLLITPAGTTADVAGCTVAVAGTNIFGVAITEDFVIADNQTTATTGSKAFRTVTSITFPDNCEEGTFAATWDIGQGEKIGLKRCIDQAGDWAWSVVAGAYESTRATVAADADEVEKNTADFDGTMNGANDFDAYFIQNFRCLP
jgi:hypothetical protein